MRDGKGGGRRGMEREQKRQREAPGQARQLLMYGPRSAPLRSRREAHGQAQAPRGRMSDDTPRRLLRHRLVEHFRHRLVEHPECATAHRLPPVRVSRSTSPRSGLLEHAHEF